MFIDIKRQMQEQFSLMSMNRTILFVTDVDKEKIWDTYLNSFAPEKQQEHNCNACRSFLRQYGNIVSIIGEKVVTLWDFEANDPDFKEVITNLRKLVSEAKVRDIFVSDAIRIGVDSNVQRYEEVAGIQMPFSTPIVWNHFALELPVKFVNASTSSREAKMGEYRDTKNVFKRSLDELTQDSVETVLELIAQNSLYRGEESKGVLTEFLNQQKKYKKAVDKDNYCWVNTSLVGGTVAKIRNTAIGTLLTDLSEGKELDKAVEAFERVIAPANYKRPTALITKRMIEEAEKTINELGYSQSLERRYAVMEDISVNNLLFVDRSAKKAMGVFNELKEGVAVNPKTLKKVEEVSIDDFVEKILPTANSVELLFENGHLNNLMSVITEQHEKSPILFKWNNPFSWSYTNALSDSMKERVKAAGGKVDGDLRFSIQWNEDGKSIIDLDAHAHEPNGTHIYYSSYYRKDRGGMTPMTGQLDVDMICPSHVGVENITWSNRFKMKNGVYKLRIHNFTGHRNFDGVRAEVEFDGEVYDFAYSKPFTGYLDIADVKYDGKTFTINPLLDTKSTINSKDKWGLSTNKFQKVSMIMHSPNYWSNSIGNRHTFFILEGANNDENPRGFFNEFLKDELSKDRKVFEVLGNKLKLAPADKQLSGVGFSSTQRNSVICKVSGKFDRLLKINF